MHTATYQPPVDKLLTYLAVESGKALVEVNYAEVFNFKPEDIPELIRMATDTQLTSEEADDLEFTAPVHALRALTQMHVESAIEPLISLLDTEFENDWLRDDLIHFYGTIGPKAFPVLQAYMADTVHEIYARSAASSAVAAIGQQHPETRLESIEILTRQLEIETEQFSEFNAFIISELIRLHAVEAATAMEGAFAGDYVDTSICGDWDSIQVDLGLKEHTDKPRQPSIRDITSLYNRISKQETEENRGSEQEPKEVRPVIVSPPLDASKPKPRSAPQGFKNKVTKKAKAKMEKASRKQNRH